LGDIGPLESAAETSCGPKTEARPRHAESHAGAFEELAAGKAEILGEGGVTFEVFFQIVHRLVVSCFSRRPCKGKSFTYFALCLAK